MSGLVVCLMVAYGFVAVLCQLLEVDVRLMRWLEPEPPQDPVRDLFLVGELSDVERN